MASPEAPERLVRPTDRPRVPSGSPTLLVLENLSAATISRGPPTCHTHVSQSSWNLGAHRPTVTYRRPTHRPLHLPPTPHFPALICGCSSLSGCSTQSGIRPWAPPGTHSTMGAPSRPWPWPNGPHSSPFWKLPFPVPPWLITYSWSPGSSSSAPPNSRACISVSTWVPEGVTLAHGCPRAGPLLAASRPPETRTLGIYTHLQAKGAAPP